VSAANKTFIASDELTFREDDQAVELRVSTMSMLSRLIATFRRRKLENEIAEEMRFHLDARTQLNMQEGQTVEEARSAALRQFGNPMRQQDETREVDLIGWMETLGDDLRYAVRLLHKNLSFTLFAVMALSLGISATTLMFSVVKSLLLEPLPYQDASRLHMVWNKIPHEERISFSTREFLAYTGQSQVFDKLTAFTGHGFVISGQGEPQLVVGQLVTPSFFQVLGVAPELGRGFLDSEGEPGRDREVVLSHQLWKERFPGSKDAVGQTITMNGDAYTVVGVMPASFEFPAPIYKLWVPAVLKAGVFQQHPDAHFLRVLGHLKPSTTISQMQAEIGLLNKRLDPEGSERRYYSVSLSEMTTGKMRRPLLVLLCAVGLLLIIACANVSNMMLARATARQREMAVRAALGASRRRLVRQLLAETTLLSLIGGVVGVLLAYAGLALLVTSGSKNMPELSHVHLDLTVLVFVLVLSSIAGILFGLAPALNGSKTDLQSTLRQGVQSSSNRSSERTRSLLVFAEIALSSLLLVCSGLMLRSFARLVHQDPGFVSEGLLSAQAALMPNRYPDPAGLVRFYRNTSASLKRIPGVASVAMTAYLPFGGNNWGNSFEVEGKPIREGEGSSAKIRPVGPDYFHAMQIALVRGREFAETDNESAPGVAIINQVLANRFWPNNEDPIGKRIRYSDAWLTIVGVCSQVKHESLDEVTEPEIYTPYVQVPAPILGMAGRDQHYVIRMESGNGTIAESVRNIIHGQDPEIVVTLNSIQALIDDTTAQPRFRTSLIVIFSSLALVLAGGGIYAVLAYSVTQRFKELGIRLALGAQRADIRHLILGHALRLAALGTACGLLAAYFVSHFLRSLLFGVTIHDPLTYFAVLPLMLGIALLAGYWPARHASKVSPTISLRYD
jgi:predicted permease